MSDDPNQARNLPMVGQFSMKLLGQKIIERKTIGKFRATSRNDVELDPELTPKHKGPLSHEEKMEIARAVMRKNRAVLAALAK